MITSEQVRQCQNNSPFIFANETLYELVLGAKAVDKYLTNKGESVRFRARGCKRRSLASLSSFPW